MKFNYTVKDRFLRYVKIDTQSDPESRSVPSTEKQKDLARVLVSELKEMGIADAELDEKGYVYATIPSNSDKDIPVICFCSHMDTSPDCSGKDVKPVIHENYQGNEIVLPGDPDQVLHPDQHQDLRNQIGNDIITSDGTTLLGADNKAGVAEIMDAAYQLLNNKDIKHGKIRILFTPDEEIGRGVDHVDMKKLGADIGYTVDGESLGHIEDETFSADGVTLNLYGISAHPGFAKGKMINAIKLGAEVIERLPKLRMSPESTEEKNGFIHPVSFTGNIEKATLKFIIRDFITEDLDEMERYIEHLAISVTEKYPGSRYEFTVHQQYRNMIEVLKDHPHITEVAMEAMRRVGITPKKSSIRGGTDGSRLSFMGLPCPNIFAGEHAFHSKVEWVSVQDMQKAVDTIVNIAAIYEERAEKSSTKKKVSKTKAD